MVDALRRAHEWVTPDGCVIDVHPTATPARLELDGEPLGPLDGGDASLRHAQATAALTQAIDAGLFAVTAAVDFRFFTYSDSLDELRDHIAAHWRSTRIGPELAERAGALLRAKPTAGSWRVVEEVALTKLRAGGVEPSARPGRGL